MILLDKSTWDGHTIVGVIGSTSRLEIEMGKYDHVREGVGGLGGLWGGMMGGVRAVLLSLGERFLGYMCESPCLNGILLLITVLFCSLEPMGVTYSD